MKRIEIGKKRDRAFRIVLGRDMKTCFLYCKLV
jgi:hypothetical protein